MRNDSRTNKERIAEIFAINHLNYIMSKGAPCRNVDLVVARFTEDYTRRIESVIKAVLNCKTEENWIAAGNHKITFDTWERIHFFCENAET